MNRKKLCVEDGANDLEAHQRNLRRKFAIDIASGGAAALERMAKEGPYAVVVADMQMPGMNGVEFLCQAQQRAPDTVRLMLTGNADQKTAVEAMNRGHVFQFLNKPCPPEMLASALDNGLKQHRLITAEREILEQTLNGAIKMLTEILASAEPRSFGCGEKLRDYMRIFASSLQASQSWELELAAMLAPIGCVTVPPGLLDKMRLGQELTGSEQEMLARLPEIGANLLAHVPRLESVTQIIRYQHKNYDGSGFPSDGVKGDALPIGARILRVLSDLAEHESAGLSKAQALEQMQTQAGRYDPQEIGRAS